MTGADTDPTEGPQELDPAVDEPFEVQHQQPRFCHACGAALDPATGECEACARRIRPLEVVPEPPPAPGLSLRSALGLYFAFLSTTLISAVALDDEVLRILVPEAVDSVIVLLWSCVAWRSLVPLLVQPLSPVWMAAAGGLGGATFLIASLAIGVFVHVFSLEEILLVQPFLDQGYGWPVVVLAGCVQPAIVEEIAFRGIILSALERVLGRRDGVLVSALLFMVIHLAVGSFPHLLLLGLVLGWLRFRTGTILPGMVLHFVHNALCILGEVYRSA